jgi:hypothetical protein
MTPRRLLPVLALAAALLVPATAQAAAPGVNVADIGYDGVPAGGWQNVTDSGAKQIRGFVNWQNVRGASRDYEMQRYRLFADQAKARGLRVLLTVTGTAGAMPSTPADCSARWPSPSPSSRPRPPRRRRRASTSPTSTTTATRTSRSPATSAPATRPRPGRTSSSPAPSSCARS